MVLERIWKKSVGETTHPAETGEELRLVEATRP
jgi:hypothetical protein